MTGCGISGDEPSVCVLVFACVLINYPSTLKFETYCSAQVKPNRANIMPPFVTTLKIFVKSPSAS